MQRKLLLTIILSYLIPFGFIHAFPVQAQSEGIAFNVEYSFGKQLEFSGVIPEGLDIKELWLFFTVEGEQQTRAVEAEIQENRRFSVRYELSDYPIRAFTKVNYWVEANLIDGRSYKSITKTLIYEDNRFEWQSRQADMIRVHWYEGDTLFAQAILDVAELGLDNVENLLQSRLEKEVEIYTYANAQEMRAALQTRGPSWVGAHTDPDLGVMVISLPSGPEQRLEMERQIPHELMHILLHQDLDTSYDALPVWLNEGLASMAELYPNPDYLVLLDKAQNRDTLLPISSLCQAFPREASGAFLAYAQATSFTRYILQKYGSDKLGGLIDNYANGMDCERGIQATYDITLTQLERQWRREAFGENSLIVALEKLSPWLILMGAALLVPLVLILSSRNRKEPNHQTT